MTPSARVQAAIELLDLVITATARDGAAADTIIADWFRSRRFAGSKDRRAIREHVYAAIRRYGEAPESGRAAMLGLLGAESPLFDGSAYGPASPHETEVAATSTGLAPWLTALLPDQAALGLDGRAPLDLRVNRLRASRDAILAALGAGEAIAGLADGIRLNEGFPIESHAVWRDGLVEVQDAGSQWIVQLCAAAPGMSVIDLCAGGGGKTLALAAAMAGKGRIVACDVNRDRLSRLAPRAARAGATAIETRLLDAGREAEALADLAQAGDLVLVDAPCSGSGTWRRNPEARWRMRPERLARVIAQQRHVLDLAAPLVRPGGALVYAVCSVIAAEGADQADAFVRRHPDFAPEPLRPAIGVPAGNGLLLSPLRDATDGFFIARLARC